MPETAREHAVRLESLWQGRFGNAYTERNAGASSGREAFWRDLLSAISPGRVLEVGCNLGPNLRWIAQRIPPRDVWGVDVNEAALGEARARVPGVNAVWARALELPFRDGFFDLVFTTGVLIHQPPELLREVMAEIVRCSRRWVLCGEYFAESPTDILYRGQEGALHKCDFGGMYLREFPDLRLLRTGFLPRGSGWDDVTFWLLERRG